MKPGGWVELQEFHHFPMSNNRTQLPWEHPVAQYWRLVDEGLRQLGVMGFQQCFFSPYPPPSFSSSTSASASASASSSSASSLSPSPSPDNSHGDHNNSNNDDNSDSNGDHNNQNHVTELMRRTGLICVTERVFHVPVGAWPRNKALKNVGVYWKTILLDGLQAIALRPLMRGLSWNRDQVETFLVSVRRAYNDNSYQIFMPLVCVYGQKPLCG